MTTAIQWKSTSHTHEINCWQFESFPLVLLPHSAWDFFSFSSHLIANERSNKIVLSQWKNWLKCSCITTRTKLFSQLLISQLFTQSTLLLLKTDFGVCAMEPFRSSCLLFWFFSLYAVVDFLHHLISPLFLVSLSFSLPS